MRAVVYRGINDMRVETVPVPHIGPGELLVKIATCGICGTDLKKIHYRLALRAAHLRPRNGGHGRGSWRGRDSVYRVGERVMVFHHVPCGECYYCRKGTPAQCPLYKKNGGDGGIRALWRRVCRIHPRDGFRGRQWRRGAHSRRCSV